MSKIKIPKRIDTVTSSLLYVSIIANRKGFVKHYATKIAILSSNLSIKPLFYIVNLLYIKKHAIM